MNNDTLFLFTAQYPYGTGETFIETELSVLSSRFSKIYIFPLKAGGEARPVPENVQIIDWAANYHYNGINALLKNMPLFLKIILKEVNACAVRSKFTERFSEFRSMLLQNVARAECVKEQLKKWQTENSVFYTYWFDDWATVLGILKEKGEIPGYVSRAHGFDLYDERREGGIIPFRNFQIRSVDAVFTISKFGRDYLTKKFPGHAAKIKLSYLGVTDRGENPFKQEEVIRLVSCSNLIPLKRIHLLIGILKNVSVKLSWLHFGDGPLRAELETQSRELPANVVVEFKGQAKNKDIIRFYKENPVHLFINTSETEGIPVTIQEAISFGIPVIAPEVGGIAEIVTEKTGILIPADFDVQKVAQLINEFGKSDMNTLEFRAGCREFWKNTFDAETNYGIFCKQLLEERSVNAV